MLIVPIVFSAVLGVILILFKKFVGEYTQSPFLLILSDGILFLIVLLVAMKLFGILNSLFNLLWK